MPVWSPKYRATDVRALLGNLITFFESNQAAALAWASPARTLANLTWYKTAEVEMCVDFPHAGVLRRRFAVDDSEELPKVRYDLTLEIELDAAFTKATRTAALAQLVADLDAYALAVESMCLNIPNATLLSGTTGVRLNARAVAGSDPFERAISDTKALFNTQLTVTFLFLETPYG